MSRFKFEIGETVVHRDGRVAAVTAIYPYPFLPDWMVKPNYNITFSIKQDSDIVKQRDIRHLNELKLSWL